MSKSTKPYSIGRIVLYVPAPDSPEAHNGATVLPAVIVRTWENSGYQNDEVNLKVLHDGPLDTWRTSVPHSETKEPGTWHWPEIIEAKKSAAAAEDDDTGGSAPPPNKDRGGHP